MSDLLKKLNEMEARHAAELKEIRQVLKKERDADDKILGGIFKIVKKDGDWCLIDAYDDVIEIEETQLEQLRAIENILQTAYKRAPGNMVLYDAFKEAEKLNLKF